MPNLEFSQTKPLIYLQFLKKTYKSLGGYKLFEIYIKFNWKLLLKRKAFNKWKSISPYIYGKTNLLLDQHIVKNNGHCISCLCLNKNHCPGCCCSKIVFCNKCECKLLINSLKQLIYKYFLIKEINPKRYYYYIWKKKVSK